MITNIKKMVNNPSPDPLPNMSPIGESSEIILKSFLCQSENISAPPQNCITIRILTLLTIKNKKAHHLGLMFPKEIVQNLIWF